MNGDFCGSKGRMRKDFRRCAESVSTYYRVVLTYNKIVFDELLINRVSSL